MSLIAEAHGHTKPSFSCIIHRVQMMLSTYSRRQRAIDVMVCTERTHLDFCSWGNLKPR